MIRAVLFDMDGVISDTQVLHTSVDIAVLKHYGITLTEDKINNEFAGTPDKQTFKKLFRLHGIHADANEAIEKKWKIMMARADDEIVPVPGAQELIYKLKQAGLKLAVASSSPMIFINTVLSKLNIQEQFEVIKSGEEVASGKPHPEIFLATAKELQVQPDECVVIEDSLNGMKAAKNAHMTCIGLIRRKNPSNPDFEYPADILVNSLEELTPEQIRHLSKN